MPDHDDVAGFVEGGAECPVIAVVGSRVSFGPENSAEAIVLARPEIAAFAREPRVARDHDISLGIDRDR
jgi:hypothetical protein